MARAGEGRLAAAVAQGHAAERPLAQVVALPPKAAKPTAIPKPKGRLRTSSWFGPEGIRPLTGVSGRHGGVRTPESTEVLE